MICAWQSFAAQFSGAGVLGRAEFKLYHGTSTFRWKLMKSENRLRIAPFGDTVVSMSTDPSVAEHFADMAREGDEGNGILDPRNTEIVLVLSGRKLLERRYDLRPCTYEPSDPCAWES
jgi:hypothetical protein